MKSKGLFGKKYLNIEEREQDIGAPGDDHVIVKIQACGVCGTDINLSVTGLTSTCLWVMKLLLKSWRQEKM